MNSELMFSSEGDLWRTDPKFLLWLRDRFTFTLDCIDWRETCVPVG